MVFGLEFLVLCIFLMVNEGEVLNLVMMKVREGRFFLVMKFEVINVRVEIENFLIVVMRSEIVKNY